jgi:hypothetical protein
MKYVSVHKTGFCYSHRLWWIKSLCKPVSGRGYFHGRPVCSRPTSRQAVDMNGAVPVKRKLPWSPNMKIFSRSGGQNKWWRRDSDVCETIELMLLREYYVNARWFRERMARSWAHLHSMPRLRMSGAVTLLRLYAFMARSGIALTLSIYK